MPQKEVGKRSSITFFVFGTLLVTFWSLFLMLLSLFSSLFCQTPFAGLFLRQGQGEIYRGGLPRFLLLLSRGRVRLSRGYPGIILGLSQHFSGIFLELCDPQRKMWGRETFLCGCERQAQRSHLSSSLERLRACRATLCRI